MVNAILLKLTQKERNAIYFLTAVFFLVQVFLFFRFGIVTENEAAKYVRQGNLLYDTGGFSDTKYIFYLPVILLVYLTKVLGVGYWFVVAVQVLLSWIAMLCFFKLTSRLVNTLAGITGALLLILFIPLQSWNFYLYSDSIFISLTTIFLFILFRYGGQGLKGDMVVILFLAMLQFVRPHGFLLIPPVVIYFLFKKQSKSARIRSILFSVFAFTGMYFLLKLAFTGGGDMDAMKPFLEEHIICFVPLKPEGVTGLDVIKTDNPVNDLLYYVVHNKLHFLKLMMLKLYSFFKLSRPFYSLVHNLLLLVFAIPIYFFAIKGLFHLRTEYRNFFLFLLSFLILYPLGATLQCDDWHSRFTMVVIPPIILLAVHNFQGKQVKHS